MILWEAVESDERIGAILRSRAHRYLVSLQPVLGDRWVMVPDSHSFLSDALLPNACVKGEYKERLHILP